MNQDAKVISMFVFFAAGETWFSGLIKKVCGGWSHMGIGFRLDDGSAEYFEALYAKGVRGPKPLQDLIDWSWEVPSRQVAIVNLPWIPPYICERKYGISRTYVGMAGYGELKLLVMWCFEKVSRKIGLKLLDSTRQVVCSTFAARVLYPDYPLTDKVRLTDDEVTPGSAWEVVKADTRCKPAYYPQALQEEDEEEGAINESA